MMMFRRWVSWSFALSFLLACAGDPGSTPPPPPELDDFVLPPAVRQTIDAQLDHGESAGGAYTYAGGVLTIDVGASTFRCEGPPPGFSESGAVTLSATELHWALNEETLVFERVDAGTADATSIVGVWEDDGIFLVLTSDGVATITGPSESCANDRPRNEHNCFEVGLSGASITVDGDLSDWGGVRQSARISDPADDYVGMDAGVDFREIAMEIEGDNLFVLMRFAEAPSEMFGANGGSYRLHVRGDTGEWTWDLTYDPVGQQWSAPGMPIQIGVGADGFEFGVPLSYVASDAAVLPIVRAEAYDCTSSPCVTADEPDCAAFTGLRRDL